MRCTAVLGCPLFIAVAGCSTFDGLTVSKRDGGSGSAKCGHYGPQPRSGYTTFERMHPLDLTLAISHLDFGDSTNGAPWDARTVGFDLDDTCTGEGEGPSCVEPAGAGIAQLDGPKGIDNAAATIKLRRDAGGSATDSVNRQIASGGPNTVYVISGYNGLPVDGRVDVALYAVTKEGWSDDEWHPFIEWTGGDADAGDAGAPVARYTSVDAYVSNNILVATFDRVRLLPAHFSNAILQARLEQGMDGLWTLTDGVFAGRMNADDGLLYIEGQQDPTSHDVVCRDSASYQTFKQNVCALADISFSGNDPSQPCDAISSAWKFEAVTARLSPKIDLTTVSSVDLCKPFDTPASDHCDR
jgi:hypothetical protein